MVGVQPRVADILCLDCKARVGDLHVGHGLPRRQVEAWCTRRNAMERLPLTGFCHVAECATCQSKTAERLEVHIECEHHQNLQWQGKYLA